MNSNTGCLFCRIGKKGLLEELPSKFENGQPVPCNRGIYEDAYCVATLAPEQYTRGHALVVLKNHRTDMADSSISSEEIFGFTSAIHKLAKHLKENLRSRIGNAPDKIYVCSLCDGVEHLHAHLIPRYPFTDEDVKTYKKLFKERDSETEIEEAVEKGKLGGFWYIAEPEQKYKKSEFWNKPDEERARCLEEMAQRLRLSLL